MEKRIPVIIPAYEPDEKMIRLLQTLQEAGIERIVVVDDGSGNEYRNLFEQAKQLGAIVLTHAVNLGKGRALKTAFNEVLNRYPEAIGAITADSDGQHTPACIQKCMEAMEKEPEKLILGCRNFDQEACIRLMLKYNHYSIRRDQRKERSKAIRKKIFG